jgi:hypothetical protein
MHAVDDGLPSYLVTRPPFLLGVLKTCHHLLATTTHQAELSEVYCPCLHFGDFFEIALKGVKLTPVLSHQLEALMFTLEKIDPLLHWLPGT